MNMKNGGLCNVRKHRDTKGSDKYTTLDILLKFGSLDKMIITSSEPKKNFGISGKGLITFLGLKAKNKAKEIQKGKVFHQKYQYEGTFKDYQGV